MKHTIYIAALAALLSACGGGSSSGGNAQDNNTKDNVKTPAPVKTPDPVKPTKKPELTAQVIKQTESIAILSTNLKNNTDNKITQLIWTIVDAPNGSKLKNKSKKSKPNTVSTFTSDVKGTYVFKVTAEGTDIKTTLTVDTNDKNYDSFHQLNIKLNQDTIIPNASTIKATQGSKFICVLQEKPTDSQAKVDSTTCKIAADKVGDYRITSLHAEKSRVSAHEYVVRATDAEFVEKPLTFEPIEVKYSEALDAMVMLDKNKALHVFKGDTKLKSIALPTSAVSMDVSDDGKYAAVSHDARASYIDLAAGKVVKTFVTPNSFSGLTIDNNLKGVAIPLSNNWETPYFIDYKKGTYKKPTSHNSAHGGILLTKKNGYIYGINVGLSPTDIRRFNVSGEEVTHYDSSYHGDFPMCGNIWLFENAKRVVTGCGTTFYTNNTKAKDMIYAGSFKFSKGVKAFSHSAKKKEVLLSPNSLNKDAAHYDRKGTDVIYSTDDTYLDLKKTILLPKPSFSASTKTNPQLVANWIHHNNDGSKYSVVVKTTTDKNTKSVYKILSEK